MLGMDQQWDVRCWALSGEHWAGLMGRHRSQVRHDPPARDEISSHSRYFSLLTCGLLPFWHQTTAYLMGTPLSKSIKGRWWRREGKQEGHSGRASFRVIWCWAGDANRWSVCEMNGSSNDVVSLLVNMRRGNRLAPGQYLVTHVEEEPWHQLVHEADERRSGQVIQKI